MITRRLFKLVLFFILSVMIESFDHKIDLSRCKTDANDAACFIRDSCLYRDNNTSGQPILSKPEHLVQYIDQKLLEPDTCDVMVEIKAFSDFKFHVMMQVTSQTKDLKSESGIKFKQKDILFACTESETTGRLTPKTLGNQIFMPEVIFCSLLIESTEKIESLFPPRDYADQLPTLIYETTVEEKSVTYQHGANLLWRKPIATCDPTILHSAPDDTSDIFILNETDTTLPSIKCASPFLLIRIDNGSEILANDFKCTNYKYTYHKAEAPEKEEIVPDNARIDVHCAEKFCSLCHTPLTSKNCGEGCTDLIHGSNSCTPTTCFKDKWRLSDGSVVTTKAECMQSEKDKRSAGWFITDGSEKREITEGSCSENFDCRTFSSLNLTCSSEDCEKAINDGLSIKCSEGHVLDINSKLNGQNITCDLSTGLYKTRNGVTVERNAKVVCKTEDAAAGAESAPMSAGSKAMVGISIIIVIFIIVGLVILACWCLKRRRSTQKSPPSLANTEGMKTGRSYNSKEFSKASSKSQSASEAPPSTDRPSKEKMQDSGGNDKKEEKKEEIKEEKKEEKKEESKEDKKDDAKEETKEKVNNPKRLSMDMNPVKRRVSTLAEVNREMKQFKDFDPMLVGKKVNAIDMPVEQLLKAKDPGDRIKHWDNSLYKSEVLPLVTHFSEQHRLIFLQSLATFNNYRPLGPNSHPDPEFGTLTQLFQVVRECHTKKLECKPTWEFIFRLVKILCHYLLEKEGSAVIKRMKDMMVECAKMMIEVQGLVRRIDQDTPEMLYSRELAMRILWWAKDPVAMEEIRKQAEGKPDEVDLPVQTHVFSVAINTMGKKTEVYDRLVQEATKQRKENPKPKDRPFGTIRQHLIYALCSNVNTEEIGKSLEMATEVMKEGSPPTSIIDPNPTDMLHAYKGATEDPSHFEIALPIFVKNADDNIEDVVNAILDEFTKTKEERKEMKDRLRQDIIDMCLLLAENCVSLAQWMRVYTATSPYLLYTRKPGVQECDPEKLSSRASNLEAMLKDKKCIDWIDEALKKSKY